MLFFQETIKFHVYEKKNVQSNWLSKKKHKKRSALMNSWMTHGGHKESSTKSRSKVKDTVKDFNFE